MQTTQTVSLAEVVPSLAPMLRPKLGPTPSLMEKTITEGLVLPDATGIARAAVDSQTVRRPMAEAVEWTARVVRPEYLRSGWERRMIPLSSAVNGQDVIAGGWGTGSKAVQVIVTMQRLHVITRFSQAAAGDEQAMARRALENAVEVLAIDELAGLDEWVIEKCAALVAGRREVEFAANWPDTLLFVTDGTAVKYSVLRIKNRSSPPQKVALGAKMPSWFEAARSMDAPGKAEPGPVNKNEVE